MVFRLHCLNCGFVHDHYESSTQLCDRCSVGGLELHWNENPLPVANERFTTVAESSNMNDVRNDQFALAAPATEAAAEPLPPTYPQQFRCHFHGCRKTFNREDSLADHRKQGHPRCKVSGCGAGPFLNAKGLSNHRKDRHTGVQNHRKQGHPRCKVSGCGAGPFLNAKGLSKHQKDRHTGVQNLNPNEINPENHYVRGGLVSTNQSNQSVRGVNSPFGFNKKEDDHLYYVPENESEAAKAIRHAKLTALADETEMRARAKID